MEVTLKPDNRKATIIGGISDDLVKVRLQDGRELPWPVSKINMPPKEGEETLNVVVIPAIKRLEEFISDRRRLMANNVPIGPDKVEICTTFENELRTEAEKEFLQKWGLSSPKQKEPPTPNETSPMTI